MKTRIDEKTLYDFLDRIKLAKLLTVRDMTEEEIYMANVLTDKKLLTRIVTRTTTVYTYGVNGMEKHNAEDT